jgi:hypothetical protein
MALALLLATGVAVSVTIQLLVRRYWFSLFLSIVATMIVWILTSLLFALVTTHPLVSAGEWSNVEAVLGAALIAQIVAIYLRRFR